MKISTVATHALWSVSTLWIAALAAILALFLEEPCAAQPFDHEHVYSPAVVYMPPTSAGDYPHASPKAMERCYDFSHIDWYDADFRLDPFGPNHDKNYSPQTDPEGWARFIRRHREQVEEILGNYGAIFPVQPNQETDT